LINDQTAGAENGIYELTTVGDGASIPWVLTRVTDADTSAELDSAAIFVQQGATCGDKGYTQTASGATIGTTALTFVQFTGTGVTDHGALTGLSDDDHSQYALLAGRTGGQTLQGGDASGNDLTLESTSNATKGTIIMSDRVVFPASTAAGAGTGSWEISGDTNTGMFSDGADALAWQTGGTEAFRLDSSQDATFAANVQINGQAWSTADSSLTTGATVSAIDFNASNVFDLTLTNAAANAFPTPTNMKDGATYIFIIRQSATGGDSATFPATFVFPNGVAPNLSTGANEVDVLSGVSDGTNIYCDILTNNVLTRKVEVLTVSGSEDVTLSETPADETAVQVWLRGGVHQVHKSWDGTTYDYDVSGTTVDFDDGGGTTGDVTTSDEVIVAYDYEA
jgi:hypothetical protein